MSRLNEGMFSGDRGDWETPQAFYDLVDAEFGFTLDAAASPENAKAPDFYTIEDDALSRLWQGTVWVNPPYGRGMDAWVRKGYEASRGGATVVMLIPARTDTGYWHEFCMKASEIRLIRGRLVFVGASENAPFPSALIIFRPGDHTPAVSTFERGELAKRGVA